jgi:hypothetical protein
LTGGQEFEIRDLKVEIGDDLRAEPLPALRGAVAEGD